MLDKIRSLCAQRGITVSQLETDTGISKNSIYRWQANMPSIDKVQKVASYFGITTSELLGEETKKDPAQSAESLLSAELSDLSDAELRDVLDFIRFKKSQRNQ